MLGGTGNPNIPPAVGASGWVLGTVTIPVQDEEQDEDDPIYHLYGEACWALQRIRQIDSLSV